MKRHIGLLAALALLAGTASACAAEAPPTEPAASEWQPEVKTDWSQLTAYEAPEELYTRLSEERMPELIPSGDYGPLLPYIGERVYGYDAGSRYGFVTRGGILVTDPEYLLIDLVERGEKPVYRFIKTPEYTGESGWGRADTYGVCACDGSWSTACIYEGAHCLDEVILLVRERKTNDADVIDYDGNTLYSLRDMPYFSALLPGLFEEYFYAWKDGLLNLPQAEGAPILVDQRTGALIDTGFGYTGLFSEGMAVVSDAPDGTGPYGYIDESYDLIIEQRYYEPGEFWDGMAVVREASGDFLIIDRTGAELVRAPGAIRRLGVGLFGVAGENGTRWLDGDLKELNFRPGFDGEVGALDGWYWYHAAGETILSDYKNEYVLPGIVRVVSVTGAYVEYRDGDNRNAVLRLDGTVIVPPEDRYTSIGIVETGSGGSLIMVNHPTDTSCTFELLDGEGRVIMDGAGRITYNRPADLFQISADAFFGCCDGEGRFVLRLSLLEWLPD